jgi:hypothetical protein
MDIKSEQHDERELQQDATAGARHEDHSPEEDGRERVIRALNTAFERDFDELFERDRAA